MNKIITLMIVCLLLMTNFSFADSIDERKKRLEEEKEFGNFWNGIAFSTGGLFLCIKRNESPGILGIGIITAVYGFRLLFRTFRKKKGNEKNEED